METNPTPVEVFMMIRQDGCIVDVNSGIFLRDTAGWIKVGEGHGDRYTHAQGNYLPGPIRDDLGFLNYRHSPGNEPPYEERTEAEKANEFAALPVTPPTEEQKVKTRLQAAEEALLFLMDLSMGGMF